MTPLELAIASAHLSTEFKQRVGSVITDSKGRVISSGYNKRKTHPLQMRYARKINPEQCFLHAEIDALVQCREVPHTIYVARVRKNGRTAMARPCPICSLAIGEAGIKTVVYTTDDGVETVDMTW